MHKDQLKRKAASAALSEVEDGMVLGLGSGSTVSAFVELLSEHIKQHGMRVSVVPASLQIYYKALNFQLNVTTLDAVEELDLTVDGADEVDRSLNLVKGGGGALTREKILACASKKYVIIVDESKLVERLCSKHPVPVEVLPFNLKFIFRKLRELGGRPELRVAARKNGPVVTDNGNLIVDVWFEEMEDPERLAREIKLLPGVVECGLFVGLADKVYVAYEDRVDVLRRG